MEEDVVPVNLSQILNPEHTGRVPQADHVRVDPVREAQDRERRVHAGLCLAAERDDLQEKVRRQPQVAEVLDLRPHNLRSADVAPNCFFDETAPTPIYTLSLLPARPSWHRPSWP